MRSTRFGQYELIEDATTLTYRLAPGATRFNFVALSVIGGLGFFAAMLLIVFKPLAELDATYSTVESILTAVGIFVGLVCLVGLIFRGRLIRTPLVIDTVSRRIGDRVKIEDVECVATRVIHNTDIQPSFEVILKLKSSPKPLMYLSLNSQYDASGVAERVARFIGVTLSPPP